MNEKRMISGWKPVRVAFSSVSCVVMIIGMLLPLYNMMMGDIKLAEGPSYLSVMGSGMSAFTMILTIAVLITSFFSKGLFLLFDSVGLWVLYGETYAIPMPDRAELGVGAILLCAGWCGMALSILLCIPSDYKKENVKNTEQKDIANNHQTEMSAIISENQDNSVMNKDSDMNRMAVDHGNGDDQFNLGVMYAKGIGVAQDYKKAVEHFRLAADQGNCKAQNNLGWLYANGKGVEKNDEMAVKYYKLAADQGASAAQYNMGVRYEKGKGVEQNTEMAVKYYQSAADQGHAAAKTALERVCCDCHLKLA